MRRGGAVVRSHVHLRQGGSGILIFLPVNGDINWGLVVRLEQKGAGTTGWVIDGLIGLRGTPEANHFGHYQRDFRRGLELPFGFARLGGEVAH